MGIEFETQDPGVDEEGIVGPTPVATASARALAKARAVAARGTGPGTGTDPRVLGAAPVGMLEGEILGKAADGDHVRQMLGRLAGREHEVVTALALVQLGSNDVSCTVSSAMVTFRALEREEIEWYVSTGEGVGKAGGYAIQGLGGMLVARLDGDRETVIGLPTSLVEDMLEGHS